MVIYEKTCQTYRERIEFLWNELEMGADPLSKFVAVKRIEESLDKLIEIREEILKQEEDAGEKIIIERQIEQLKVERAEIPDKLAEVSSRFVEMLIKLLKSSGMTTHEGRSNDEKRLIEKVENRWLKNYLVGDRDDPRRIPTDRHVKPRDRPKVSVAQEKSTFVIARENEDELLILGRPASGKTTELLDVAKWALEIAKVEPEKPIPVVLRLSQWDDEVDSFKKWLLDQLKEVYHMSGEALIENGKLMLLIDQLDHVALPERDRCIDLINAYVKNGASSMPVVVCCREDNYRRSGSKLDLAATLELLPLSEDQIELELEEPDLAPLRDVVNAHPVWREVLSTPFFLSTAVRACRVLEERLQGPWRSVDDVRHFLLDAYIDGAFGYVEKDPKVEVSYKPYTREEMVTWLRGLARRMAPRTDLYMEEIQPRWLDKAVDRRLYMVISRVLPGLLIGLASLELVGCTLGLLAGLGIGFLDAWRCESGSRVAGVRHFSLAAAAVVLPALVTVPFWADDVRWQALPYLGTTLAFFFMWRGWWRTPDGDVRTADIFRWRWRGFFGGIVSGVVVLVCSFLLHGPRTIVIRTLIGVPLGLTAGVVGGLFAGLLFGARGGAAEERPNHRMHKTVLSGLLAGPLVLVVPMLYGLVSTVFSGANGTDLVNDMKEVFTYPVLVAPVAVLLALLCGGADTIQHYLLRLILKWRGSLPWKLEDVLDKAADIRLLLKIGPAYTFHHTGLQDFFRR